MKNTLKLYIILCFLFIAISVFISYDYKSSPDYFSYLNWYEVSTSYVKDGNSWVIAKDPAFYILSNLFDSIGLELQGVLLTLVLISLLTKSFALNKLLNNNAIFFVLLLYLARLFITHDLIQYRAGASVGLAFLAIVLYLDNSKIKSIIALILACLVHLSAMLVLIAIPINFYLKKRKRRDLFRLILIIFLFLVCTVIVNPYAVVIEMLMKISFFQARVAPYINGTYQTVETSILNSYVLIKILSYVIFTVWVYKNRGRELVGQYYNLYFFFFSSLFGLTLYWFFRSNDSLAIRFSDFFSIFDLVFIVQLLYVFKPFGRLIYSGLLAIYVVVFLTSSLKLIA
ncbi:EpsG family protein [Leclercia adecarboxylata]|uniref:EpsG family protein n=3 Tax=Leclercia adecarboxylata TaxID=83655 RepID=A0A9X3YDW2_9ENTR|nr:EpsG family protein [Leclercia adecarboxylata]MBD1403462.1 EpsG family protein [Leclercia adecarboxylata]MDC6621091.1 EpsG family protein [Leclercia adecarboxylata]MDC6631666.1 EpsG family protein [Leclercia adecarboxylata]MDC6640456.1 EpsG family protein [Leclercia adecarboxylata]MDC6652793.1 EpsG family protein [Leclercia adecarboxylata]